MIALTLDPARCADGPVGDIMEKFGVLEAAFDIFKRRDRRGVLTLAMIGYFLVVIALAGVFFAVNGPAILDFMAWAERTDSAEPVRQLPPEATRLLLGYLIVLPVFWFAYAATEAAVHRWLVRGEAGGGVMGLKIDTAFWLVLLCHLTWIPVIIGIALFVALVVGAGIFAGSLAGGGLPGFLLGLVSTLAAIAIAIYLPARFAPASALSVAHQRYAFFEAWGATRGRALNLIGALLILLLILYAVSFAWSFTTQAQVLGVIGGLNSGRGFAEVIGGLGIVSIAILAAGYLVSLIVQLVITVAMMGVNAKLARVATAAPEMPQAEQAPV